MPTAEHERRVALLEDLATLAGFYAEAPRFTVRGVPDVLRISPRSKNLFICDAKDTETPGNLQTQLRLLRYMVDAREYATSGRSVLFGVCTRTANNFGAWPKNIRMLAAGASISSVQIESLYLGSGFQFIYFDVRPSARLKAERDGFEATKTNYFPEAASQRRAVSALW
jgi:hypothetical protein